MSKDNAKYFDKKKEWSKVKDALLQCYLGPYFQKILTTSLPLLYIDGFAGKGTFADNEDGSPLIAIKCLEHAITKSQKNICKPHMKFIESSYARDLQENLKHHLSGYIEVINGNFEDSILQYIDKTNSYQNIFLYVDPYGVKYLNAHLFNLLPKKYHSAELLLNLNSFGFLRAALGIMSVTLREKEDDVLGGIDEYDPFNDPSADKLTQIAGSDYWKEIIKKYKDDEIDIYKAEKEFSRLFKNYLHRSYAYVLDMAISLKSGNIPKYRMVFASNHEDGCILMADTISKQTKHLVLDIQDKGQNSLFSKTADNEFVDDSLLIDCIEELLYKTNGPIRLNVFLAKFFDTYGVLCQSSRLSSNPNSILKILEKNNDIIVTRTPVCTNSGKPTRFWNEKGGQTVILKKRNIPS